MSIFNYRYCISDGEAKIKALLTECLACRSQSRRTLAWVRQIASPVSHEGVREGFILVTQLPFKARPSHAITLRIRASIYEFGGSADRKHLVHSRYMMGALSTELKVSFTFASLLKHAGS